MRQHRRGPLKQAAGALGRGLSRPSGRDSGSMQLLPVAVQKECAETVLLGCSFRVRQTFWYDAESAAPV